MSFAESIHNLNIIEEFFQQHLPQMYPFKPEDLLYSPACLKSNVLAMLGELFYTCEVSKPGHLCEGQTGMTNMETDRLISIDQVIIMYKLTFPVGISDQGKLNNCHTDLGF